MSPRVVLLGATGHTGRLVAAELAGLGLPVLLTARDGIALDRLATRLSAATGTARPATAVLDVTVPGAVGALVRRGDVLVSTVGPFDRFGGPAVEACLAVGAHYLDPAGEAGFLRDLFGTADARARAAGCALVPGFGFESVPGNVAAGLALAEAGERAAAVEVLYVCDPAVASRGTRLSVAGAVLEPGHRLHRGELALDRVGSRTMAMPLGGRTVRGISIPTTEPLVLRRTHPHVGEVSTFLGGLGAVYPVLRAVGPALGLLLATRAGHRLVAAAVSAQVRRAMRVPGGPADSARTAYTAVVARVRDRAGDVVGRAVLAGADPYALTAHMLAWGAARCLDPGPSATGTLGPAEAFGLLPTATALAAVGMVRVPAGVDWARTPPLAADPTVPDPTVPDPTVPDPTVPDPTVPDPTVPEPLPQS